MKKSLIACILYLTINVLFVDKYGTRVTELNYLIDLAYLLIGGGILYAVTSIHLPDRYYKIGLWVGSVIYFIVMGALQYAIDPMTVQVDRWSAIHYFLDNLLQGIYPYAAQTHLGGYGSPFPVWQLIHLPFYLIGNVGLSIFVFIGIFLLMIARYDSVRTAFIAFILIAISPSFAYEITVRSDLVANFIGILILCRWLQQQHIRLNEHLLFIAVITGLCGSTRLSAVIPIALLYGYEFLKLPWRKELCFILVTISVWAATFLPFLLWDFNQLLFFEYNPFVLQSRQGSPTVLFLFASIAIGLVIYQKDHLHDFYIHAGGLLTLLVVLTFGYNMLSSGNYVLYSCAYDITYFNMALPFYLYVIALNRTNP